MSHSIPYNHFINKAPDCEIWKPISEEEMEHFLSLLQDTKQAFLSENNHVKGKSLENLMTFVYSRFDDIAVIYEDVKDADNQYDHIIEFIDGMVPTFIHQHIGLRIIGESKNHNKSISVREVADLNELMRTKEAKLGIFSSFRTLSRGKNKSLWQNAEGKRRKLALASKTAIIGFNLDEIESLQTENFYTLLKRKYWNLIDEIADDYASSITGDEGTPYQNQLYSILHQLMENGILTEEMVEYGKGKIIEKYGPISSGIEK